MNNCLSKPQKKPGSVWKQTNQFGGLQMESDATQNFCGNTPALTSNQENTQAPMDIGKCGVRG